MAWEEVSEILWELENIDLLSCGWYSSIIINKINIFSQNVQKNNLITSVILETCKSFNIIFIQEPPWSTICFISRPTNIDSNKLVGVPNHPDWLTFSRSSSDNKDHSCVILYVNICLSCFYFNLRKDTFNHRDISCLSFPNNGDI